MPKRKPMLRRLQDEAQEVEVTQPCEARHDVELSIPAPSGVRVDLEQLYPAIRIGSEVDAGIVPATQALEQPDCLMIQAPVDIRRAHHPLVGEPRRGQR